ncbi:hypothetical protein BO82DRAFT_370074 [Aspergillus uvarum CBS 121591]|uniref:Uncharacterized protein n=1 Tax=Aspergillus uvarum CBS 121591 TaxID=1448315 RepID=A0A319BSG9_9EURO|nr:hypothetical protein BO82DRAFT_370074 [Aspergillus uvarum CBS 121591]PYH75625.1 hypothetical protein BO82DRAFT_370074 [Aspergillus uvarum CBS 121591]
MPRVTEMPASTPSFPHPTRTFSSECSSCSSSVGTLDIYDLSSAYVRAKYTIPDDAASMPSWQTCHLLCSKIMSRLLAAELVRKVDAYYYGKTNDLRTGMVLLLTAHRRREGWVQADVSLADGTLISSAFALCVPKPTQESRVRSLASPIAFKDPQIQPTTNDFRFPFAKPIRKPSPPSDDF